MSTIRDPAYITDAGRTMMTAGGDVTYTKAVLYGQDISHLTDDQVKALTTIGSPLREVKVGISDKQNTDRGTTVILEATFQNDHLKADLPYTAVGFFAQKGNDEKLIAVAVANAGAYLTATSPDGIATDALDLKLAIAIGDATNVTATVDPAGSVTPATLNGAINKATHDLTAQIDTKANSSDVYTKKQVDDAFSSRDATIATKADKATVDAEIAKIDFTPYAKTADVNNEIKTVTDLANSKVGTDYSYSKAELDKKLLAISTDADGKVDAGQVADMITSKADKLDTYTKAEVDSKVTDAKNTAQSSVDNLNIVKADKSNTYTKAEVDSRVNDAKSTAQVSDNQIWNAVNLLTPNNQCPALPDGFDLNSQFVGWRRSPNRNLKNMPSGWTTDSMYYQGTIDNGDGLFELALNVGQNANDIPRLAYRIYAWGKWKPWKTIANDEDIASLQTQINNNDKATITTGFDWNSAIPTNETRSIQNAWLVDQQVFGGAVDRMNNLQNQITTLQNQVNDLINQINYIKQNYLQGKRFPANQEAQAQQWENANPNGIAMIEK